MCLYLCVSDCTCKKVKDNMHLDALRIVSLWVVIESNCGQRFTPLSYSVAQKWALRGELSVGHDESFWAHPFLGPQKLVTLPSPTPLPNFLCDQHPPGPLWRDWGFFSKPPDTPTPPSLCLIPLYVHSTLYNLHISVRTLKKKKAFSWPVIVTSEISWLRVRVNWFFCLAAFPSALLPYC